MSKFLQPDDPLPDFAPAQASGASEDPGFWDIFDASAEATRAVDLTSSETENRGRAKREIVDALIKDMGVPNETGVWEILSQFDTPSLRGLSAEDRVMLDAESPIHGGVAMIEKMKAYRDALPEARRRAIPDPARLEARAREIALERYTQAESITGQARGFGDGAASFMGGMAGAMTDPVNVASMMVFRRPLTTFRGAVGYGAVTSGATEIVLQPIVQDYREEVGLPAGWDIAFQNVLFATVGGGVFGAAEGGLIKLGQALEVRKRRGQSGPTDDALLDIIGRYEAGDIDQAGVREELADLARRDPVFAAANEISERAAEAEAAASENPFGLSLDALEAYKARERDAMANLAVDVDPRLSDAEREMLRGVEGALPDAPPVAAPDVPPEWSGLGIEIVDYRSLARDPKRFQFKESDGDGLTDALKDVDQWEPERAGVLLAWEAADGTRYVANGHQRHGLADRLMAGGAEPISGPAFILREADGVTAEDAMVRGALINIGEGSGTSLDAARILRADPEVGKTLPPRSPLVREARGLSSLSDDAFGLVVNGRISPRWGALVGARVPDPDLQAQIGLALEGVDPRTVTEAESVVQDLMRAPVEEGTTIDLFGEAGFKQALIAERAKVKAATLRLLRGDKRDFGTLTKKAGRIEEEGNKLDAQANRDVELQAARLIERMEREAHVKGEISDALNDAARRVADGAAPLTAARGLVDTLTGTVAGGGRRRGADAVGGSPDPVEAAPAGRGRESRLGTGLQDLLRESAGDTSRVVRAYEEAAEYGPQVADLILGKSAPAAPKPSPERLTAAAVRWRGKIYRGASHIDAVRAAETATGDTIPGIRGRAGEAEAGFTDGRGRFLSREDAALSALASGQITDPAMKRVIEARLKRGETVPLTAEHVEFSGGGRFAKAASALDDPAVLRRMDTLFVKEDAVALSRALAEAAACAAGVPMSGTGQMVAGLAIGAGIGAGLFGVALTQGTPEQRDARYEEWFKTDPDMKLDREYREEWERMKQERGEARAASLWRIQIARQSKETFMQDIERLPPYMTALQYNTWAERFTGVAAGFLDDLIAHESAMDWRAENPESSAVGGGQFIQSTWVYMMGKYGPRYGLTDPVLAEAYREGEAAARRRGRPVSAEVMRAYRRKTSSADRQGLYDLRMDPRWGTVMTAEYAKENALDLSRRLGRPLSQKDAYIAHFFGDEAYKALSAPKDAMPADLFRAETLESNRNVFYFSGDESRPRNLGQVLQRQGRNFSSAPLFIHPDVAEGRI